MHKLRAILKALAFPVYSLFSKRIGFSVFFPSLNGWWLYTRGKFVPSSGPPGVSSLEYFRYFVPQSGEIVFDVGAELGLETRQFAMMVGEKGQVFTFECFPAHLSKLLALAERYSNIKVIDKACWNRPKQLTFFRGHTPGSNTPLPGIKGIAGQPLGDEEADTLTVEAQTLDEMWKRYAGGIDVDFLKMDIEGAEWEALEGAFELLKYTKKVVVAAYHERDGVRTAPRVSQILRESGFTVRIGENLHVYATRIN